MFDSTPPWIVVVGLVWCSYQGVRGIVETRMNNPGQKWKPWKRLVVLDIHDFAFRFTCTAAGFISIRFASALASRINELAEPSVGQAVLLGTSFVIGVVGIGGQLHFLILLGKIPGLSRPEE